MKKTKQVVREIVFKIFLILRWPLALLFVAMGLLLNTYLWSQVRCLTNTPTALTEQAKMRWSGPGSDGGPILPFPRFESDSSGGHSRESCEPFNKAGAGETLMGFTMAAIGWSLFVFAFALVRFPKGTPRTRTVTSAAAWSLLVTTQVLPWEFYLTDHPALPRVIVVVYNLLVGGLLFLIILRTTRWLRAHNAVTIN